MAKKLSVSIRMSATVLPPHVSTIVATQKATPLPDLCELADELMALNIGHVSTIAKKYRPQEFNEHRNRSSNYSPKKNNSPNTLTPFNKDQRPKICRWHIFFGATARKCKNWCQWPNKQNCSISDTRPTSPTSSEN